MIERACRFQFASLLFGRFDTRGKVGGGTLNSGV